jgi:quinoprotein glucose dehydrogenase
MIRILIGVGLILVGPAVVAWDHYGGSERGLQYSPLQQIDRSNVEQLVEAWRYRTGEMSAGMRRVLAFQANPIRAENRLYVSTASAIVVALDPATGAELWRFDGQIDRSRPAAEVANRGVTSWIDTAAASGAPCRHRIYVGTLDGRLIALDGATGAPCIGFGDAGTVRLDRDVRLRDEGIWINYTLTSPPVVVGDMLVLGSAIGDNRAVDLELGIVRGLDARSGTERWRWDPVPHDPADPAYGTWRAEQVERTGAANAWPPFAADSDLGLVYVPTGSASPDFFGGERLGDNLYANSLVALEAATGKVRWYRQLVHHDVWDYDLPAQPTLADLVRNGQRIPAVVQSTKMGMLFTFDRRTGEPVFAIEERPVPQGGAAGEQLSPTQPFPVAPPPLVSHAPVTADDAWGMLYFDQRACAKRFAKYRSDGIYTPPTVAGSLLRPMWAGGGNWGGVAFDPVRQWAITNVIEGVGLVELIPRAELEARADDDDSGAEYARQAGTPYGMRREILLSPLGVPCNRPPWGLLVAADMNTGEIVWRVPFGTIEDAAPAIVPNLALGVPGIGGPIATGGGLVFIGAAMDDYLRAFDTDTGRELWRGRLPAGGQATPMTYVQDGVQYVVIAAGGHPGLGTTQGDYVVAFRLKAGVSAPAQ